MDKQKEIVRMFDEISGSYDLANRVLSFGADIRWRRIACAKSLELLGKERVEIADAACGTGDMLLFWEEVAAKKGVAIADKVGIDPSLGMLEAAQKKLKDTRFICNEAKSLQLESGSVDIVSISYGIRNVIERKEAIEEFKRVLRPGGVLVILEFTKKEHPNLIDRAADFYASKILPYIGGLISGNFKAYRYLPDSIEGFLSTQGLSDELEQAGFEKLFLKGSLGNVSTLFIYQKPANQ